MLYLRNKLIGFNMKKLLPLGLLSALLFSGCAIRPTHALLYSDATSPAQATNVSASSAKTGVSEECTNILGLFATGDCSIASAKKNGNISAVATVDWKGTNILGLYSTGRTIVTGN